MDHGMRITMLTMGIIHYPCYCDGVVETQHKNNTVIMRNDHNKWHTSRITLTNHFENVWCKQWHYDILSWFYCSIISYRWEEDSVMIVIVRYLHTENGMHMLMLIPSSTLNWLWKITMFHRCKYNYKHILKYGWPFSKATMLNYYRVMNN